jgi:hypothetical protein
MNFSPRLIIARLTKNGDGIQSLFNRILLPLTAPPLTRKACDLSISDVFNRLYASAETDTIKLKLSDNDECNIELAQQGGLVEIKSLVSSQSAVKNIEKILEEVSDVDCAFVPSMDDSLVKAIDRSKKIQLATHITPRLEQYHSEPLHFLLAIQSLVCQIIPFSSTVPSPKFTDKNIAFGESLQRVVHTSYCMKSGLYYSCLLENLLKTERGRIAIDLKKKIEERILN